jgi:hypothetical protein
MPDSAATPPPTPAGRRARARWVAGSVATALVLGAAGWWVARNSGGSTGPKEEAAVIRQAEPQAPAASTAIPAPAVKAPAGQNAPPDPDAGAVAREAAQRAAREARDRTSEARSAARRAGPAAERSPAFKGASAAEREALQLLKAGRFAEAMTRFYVAAALFTSAAAARPDAASVPSKPELPAPPAASGSGAASKPADPPAPLPAPGSTPDAGLPAAGAASAPDPPEQPPPQSPAPPSIPSAPPLTPIARAERSAHAPQPAPAEPSGAAIEDAVRELVRRYEQALEARSVDALRRVWPSLAGVQEGALRQEFMHARRIQVDVDNVQVTVAGGAATARFTRRYQLDTTDGQRLLTTSRTIITARRAGGEWLIEQVRFEAM